jgi:hypothetical protein
VRGVREERVGIGTHAKFVVVCRNRLNTHTTHNTISDSTTSRLISLLGTYVRPENLKDISVFCVSSRAVHELLSCLNSRHDLTPPRRLDPTNHTTDYYMPM